MSVFKLEFSTMCNDCNYKVSEFIAGTVVTKRETLDETFVVTDSPNPTDPIALKCKCVFHESCLKLRILNSACLDPKFYNPRCTCGEPIIIDPSESLSETPDLLESEVKRLFNLDSLPKCFEFKKPHFKHFLGYVKSKGSYQPHQDFLKLILDMISGGTYPFDYQELQMFERNFFDKFMSKAFAASLSGNVSRYLKKEDK